METVELYKKSLYLCSRDLPAFIKIFAMQLNILFVLIKQKQTRSNALSPSLNHCECLRKPDRWLY